MDLNRIRGKCVASKTKEVHAFIVGPQKSHFKNQVAITLKGQMFTVPKKVEIHGGVEDSQISVRVQVLYGARTPRKIRVFKLEIQSHF